MPNTIVQPYLWNFNGRCEEAVEFYRSKLGAEVLMMMRFKEAPEPVREKMSPDSANKIMHARFRIGESVLMASDGECEGTGKFEGISLSLTAPDEAEANRAFTALSEGGKITMPIGQTFWSPCFGMVTDKFGVAWMVTVPE